MSENESRDTIFISKATPEDDEFVLWLAPRLEAAGYKVFADVLNLEAGDRWRRRLTRTLQDHAAKMLLCCSDVTLDKTGVQEEIAIAEDLAKSLGDPNFIIPLKLERHKKLFGIGGLQWINFEKRWADGLEELIEALEKKDAPKAATPHIQPQWEQYRKRKQIDVERSPESLASNWLRVLSVPDKLFYVAPTGACNHGDISRLAREYEFPAVPALGGFLTFAQIDNLTVPFAALGNIAVKGEFDLIDFAAEGAEVPPIWHNDARRHVADLYRQAWNLYCRQKGLLSYEYSSRVIAFHAGDEQVGIGEFISWGQQGEKRRSMLRNIKKDRVWEYGVSASPVLHPFHHFRLKGRVLFSDMEDRKKTLVVPDKAKQHTLRRSLCSGWRNKAWHGRLMAFMELLAGESAYIGLPVAPGKTIVLDAMPIKFTSPVTTALPHDQDEEESDPTTLGRFFDPHGDEG